MMSKEEPLPGVGVPELGAGPFPAHPASVHRQHAAVTHARMALLNGRIIAAKASGPSTSMCRLTRAPVSCGCGERCGTRLKRGGGA